jgi:hypothetical protein
MYSNPKNWVPVTIKPHVQHILKIGFMSQLNLMYSYPKNWVPAKLNVMYSIS